MDESTTGSAFRSDTPVIADSFRHRSWGSPTSEHQALVMAPRTQDAVVGVIAVARKAEQAFNIDDLDLMSDFANHAAVALTLASAREHARALTLVADRERIAHDLHDHVIQRLFTAGMDPRIFALQPPAHCGGGFQLRVRDAVSQLTDNRDITTSALISLAH